MIFGSSVKQLIVMRLLSDLKLKKINRCILSFL